MFVCILLTIQKNKNLKIKLSYKLLYMQKHKCVSLYYIKTKSFNVKKIKEIYILSVFFLL